LTTFTQEAVGADENWESARVAAANYLAKEKLLLGQASMLSVMSKCVSH